MSQSNNHRNKNFDGYFSDDSRSTQSNEAAALKARISIYINDENVPKEEYIRIVRSICRNFGEIKTIHIPKQSKTGNLIFVEFTEGSAAEKAIEVINSDKELKMVAGHARPPKTKNQDGNQRQNAGQRQQPGRKNAGSNGNFNHEQQQSNNYKTDSSAGNSMYGRDQGFNSRTASTSNHEQKHFQQLLSNSFSGLNLQQHSSMSLSRINDPPLLSPPGPAQPQHSRASPNQRENSASFFSDYQRSDRKENYSQQQQRAKKDSPRKDYQPKPSSYQGSHSHDNHVRKSQPNGANQNQKNNQHRPQNGHQATNSQPHGNSDRNSKWSEKTMNALIPNSGKCNLCKRHAELKCGRCGDFYCSHECQRVDWTRHKPNCFPMPMLLPVSAPITPSPEVIQSLGLKTPEKTDSSPEPERPTGGLRKLPDEFNWNFKNQVEIPKKDRKIVYCDQKPQSGDIVIITWPCSTNRVYLIQAKGEMGAQYSKIIDWAANPENHGPRLEERPDKGEMVFAEYRNEWFRAIIVKVIDAEHVLVAFIDYGNAEEMHFSKLRKYSEDEEVIRYTFTVKLMDCPYDSANHLPENVSSYLREFSDNYTQLRIRYPGEWKDRETQVELFVVETDECINDKICALMNKTRAQVVQETSKNNGAVKKVKLKNFIWDDLMCNSIAVDSRMQVVFWHINDIDKNIIWCSLEVCRPLIHKLNDEVNAFAADKSNLVLVKVPAPNDLVLVKKHENWERAVILSITEDEARVMSVDYGGCYTVHREDMFEIPKKLTAPIITHMCRIHDLPGKIDGDLKEYIEKEFENGSSVVVDKISYDEQTNFHVLHMDRFIRELKNQGLLKEEI